MHRPGNICTFQSCPSQPTLAKEYQLDAQQLGVLQPLLRELLLIKVCDDGYSIEVPEQISVFLTFMLSASGCGPVLKTALGHISELLDNKHTPLQDVLINEPLRLSVTYLVMPSNVGSNSVREEIVRSWCSNVVLRADMKDRPFVALARSFEGLALSVQGNIDVADKLAALMQTKKHGQIAFHISTLDRVSYTDGRVDLARAWLRAERDQMDESIKVAITGHGYEVASQKLATYKWAAANVGLKWKNVLEAQQAATSLSMHVRASPFAVLPPEFPEAVNQTLKKRDIMLSDGIDDASTTHYKEALEFTTISIAVCIENVQSMVSAMVTDHLEKTPPFAVDGLAPWKAWSARVGELGESRIGFTAVWPQRCDLPQVTAAAKFILNNWDAYFALDAVLATEPVPTMIGRRSSAPALLPTGFPADPHKLLLEQLDHAIFAGLNETLAVRFPHTVESASELSKDEENVIRPYLIAMKDAPRMLSFRGDVRHRYSVFRQAVADQAASLVLPFWFKEGMDESLAEAVMDNTRQRNTWSRSPFANRIAKSFTRRMRSVQEMTDTMNAYEVAAKTAELFTQEDFDSDATDKLRTKLQTDSKLFNKSMQVLAAVSGLIMAAASTKEADKNEMSQVIEQVRRVIPENFGDGWKKLKFITLQSLASTLADIADTTIIDVQIPDEAGSDSTPLDLGMDKTGSSRPAVSPHPPTPPPPTCSPLGASEDPQGDLTRGSLGCPLGDIA